MPGSLKPINIYNLLKNTAKGVFLSVIAAKPKHNSSAVVLTPVTKHNIFIRYTGIIFILFAFVAVLICKMWQIQISEHHKHLAKSDKILGFKQKVIGERGKIYDLNHNMLVGNNRTKDLYIIPKNIVGEKDKNREQLHDFLNFLSVQLRLDRKLLHSKVLKILDRELVVPVAKNVPPTKTSTLWSINIPGLDFQPAGSGLENHWDIFFRPMEISNDKDRDYAITYLEYQLNLESDKLFIDVIRGMRKQTPLLVASKISINEAGKLEKAFADWNVKVVNGKATRRSKIPKSSVYFEDSTIRYYPQNKLMANLLGFCDADNVGLSGVERLMDKEMRPNATSKTMVLDGPGIRKLLPETIYNQDLNGSDVYLTIQLPIQQAVEASMERLVREHSPKRAYMVMLHPKTGAIMAMAQYPNFDRNGGNNERASREFHALISGYEPGSIMKGPTVSSAMDYANLTPDTEIYCENGFWHFAGRPLKEHGRARFGDLKIRDIIKKSSNIGSAKAVIENMEPNVFYSYLRSFGFGQRTGLGFYPENKEPICFTNESHGILKSVENWYKIDISRIAIGHTILVTPLQMVQAYCALANNGEIMQPYIIDRVVTPDGKVIPSVPFKKGQPINPATVQKMKECLCATIEPGGTGTKGAVEGYTVAAKTGTAMKLAKGPNGKYTYSGNLNTASFIGFVPAEDPAFIFLVTADEPTGREQYGGSVCGDHFAEVAAETLKILQIPPKARQDEMSPVSTLR